MQYTEICYAARSITSIVAYKFNGLLQALDQKVSETEILLTNDLFGDKELFSTL